VRTLRGLRTAETPLAAERRQVLAAVASFATIEGSDPTGPAIARRLGIRSTGAKPGAEQPANAGDQSLLYPALHSLEAAWRVRATWLPAPDGSLRRTYRERHLIPWRLGRPEAR
jgi:DNA-binding PadR family transcriptional regulator